MRALFIPATVITGQTGRAFLAPLPDWLLQQATALLGRAIPAGQPRHSSGQMLP